MFAREPLRSCKHCGERIMMTRLFEFIAQPEPNDRLGSRPVDIWLHLLSGHERCLRSDTCAEPED